MEFKKLLAGKKGLITGVANHMSMASEIAKKSVELGAEIAIAYQAEQLKSRVEAIAKNIGCSTLLQCDASKQDDIKKLFADIKNMWGSIDFVVHAIAYSNKDELKGKFLDTSLENFTNSMNISCYSLISMAREAEKIMNENGSIISLTYYGSNKVVPNYNVMGVAKAALESSTRYLARDLGPKGIRVNTISAGPIRTLAASAIGDFKSMLNNHASTSPLKRNTTQADVASSAMYFISDMSSGVTGEIHYVDCGYNIMGTSV